MYPMGNSASSQGSSTGTHDGDVGSSVSEEQHDWPIEQTGYAIAAGDAKTLQLYKSKSDLHDSETTGTLLYA